MTAETIDALLDLWTKWPECKPVSVDYDDPKDGFVFADDHGDSVLLDCEEASDLACAAIERAMLTCCRLCFCCPHIHGTKGPDDRWTMTVTSWQVQFSTMTIPDAGGCVSGDTKLAALIEAANAVLNAREAMT